MTEISVSKLVCDIDIHRNYLVPLQPAKSPHDLAEDSGAGMAWAQAGWYLWILLKRPN